MSLSKASVDLYLWHVYIKVSVFCFRDNDKLSFLEQYQKEVLPHGMKKTTEPQAESQTEFSEVERKNFSPNDQNGPSEFPPEVLVTPSEGNDAVLTDKDGPDYVIDSLGVNGQDVADGSSTEGFMSVEDHIEHLSNASDTKSEESFLNDEIIPSESTVKVMYIINITFVFGLVMPLSVCFKSYP